MHRVVVLGSSSDLSPEYRFATFEPQHCSLSSTSAGIVLRDLSDDGVSVNEKEVGKRVSVMLQDKDRLTIGQVSFVFQPTG